MSFGSSRRMLCVQRGSKVLIFSGEWTERGRFLAQRLGCSSNRVFTRSECALDREANKEETSPTLKKNVCYF